MKIDKRKSYYLIVDTETANSLEDSLFYDIGMAIIDKQGNVYESYSFVNNDIFKDESELMKSAYYANKIPLYYQSLWTLIISERIECFIGERKRIPLL